MNDAHELTGSLNILNEDPLLNEIRALIEPYNQQLIEARLAIKPLHERYEARVKQIFSQYNIKPATTTDIFKIFNDENPNVDL